MVDGLNLEEFEALEKSAKAEAEKYDSPILAGVEGVARGVTFGLSDAALASAGGPELAEDIRKRKEFNPAADLIGQGAGIIGSSLLGPVGLVGAVTKAGKIAEGVIAKALVDTAAKSTAKKILSNATAKGLGATVEGAFYGAGHVISEASLGDPKVAAENALSTIGLSSLLSGGLVGSLNVAGPAIKALSGMAKPYLKQARQSFVGVSREIEDVILTKSDDIKSLLDSADTVEEAVAARWAETAAIANDARYATIDSVKTNVDDLINKNALMGKTQSIRPLFNEIQKAKDKLSPLGKELTKEVESEFAAILDTEHRLVDYVLDNAGIDFSQRALTFKLTFKDILKSRIPASSWRLNPAQLNEVKTTYFKSAGFAKQIGKTSASEQLYETLGAITNKQLDKISPKIRAENARLGRSMKAQESLKAYGLFERGEFNLEKLRKLSSVKDAAMWNEIRGHLQVLDEVWGTDLLDTALITRAAKEVAPNDIISSFQTGRSVLAPLTGAVFGTALGGPVGAAVGAGVGLALSSPAGIAAKINAARSVQSFLSGNAMGSLTRLGGRSGALVSDHMIPFVSAQVAAMSQLEKANKSADRQIDAAVKGISSDDDFETTAPTNLRALSLTNYGGGRVMSDDDRQKAFSKRLEELQNIMVNPENMASLMDQNLRGLSMIAPQISEQLAINGVNAAMFLYNKAPRGPSPNAIGLKQEWEPSDSQLASWERYVDAVENPYNVLSDLKQRRLTKEGVEALQVVYPSLYQKLLQKISEKLFDKSLKYQDRLMLSSLFKIPVDSAVQPRILGVLQSNFINKPAGVSPARSQNINFSGSRKTRSQQIEGRE